jgi:hypothetical protein
MERRCAIRPPIGLVLSMPRHRVVKIGVGEATVQLQPRDNALKEDAALLYRYAVGGGPDGPKLRIGTTPIENPPLPRPRPLSLDATGDNPAVLISAFRHQHGEDSVLISADLTHIAQEQTNAMATRDTLDHNALAPFSSRIGRSGFSRAAENIA